MERSGVDIHFSGKGEVSGRSLLMGDLGTKALLSIVGCFFTFKLKRSALIEELLLLIRVGNGH